MSSIPHKTCLYHFIGQALVRETGGLSSTFYASPQALYHDGIVYKGIHSAYIRVYKILTEYVVAFGSQEAEKPIRWTAMDIFSSIDEAVYYAKAVLEPYIKMARRIK